MQVLYYQYVKLFFRDDYVTASLSWSSLSTIKYSEKDDNGHNKIPQTNSGNGYYLHAELSSPRIFLYPVNQRLKKNRIKRTEF